MTLDSSSHLVEKSLTLSLNTNMQELEPESQARQEALLETVILSSKQGTLSYLGEKLKDTDPSDIAQILPLLEPELKGDLLEVLKEEMAALVLEEADETSVRDVFDEMELADLDDIIPHLPVDEAADVLQQADSEDARIILDSLSDEQRKSVEDVLLYPEDSAGGIMTTDYLSMNPDVTVAAAEREIKEHHKVEDNINEIYIVDSDGRIQGFVTLRKLITSPDTARLGDIMVEKFIHLNVNTDQEEVARTASRYNLDLVPVTDDSMRLVGVVTSDDIMEVLEEEHTEDLHKVAGMLGEGAAGEVVSTVSLLRLRLPWLILTLLGQFISAAILDHYGRMEMREFMSIVIFVPVVMALSGNVGIQSAILITRGLTTRLLTIKVFRFLLWREIKSGVLIGIILASIIGIVSFKWLGDTVTINLAIGVSVSCLIAIVVSNIIGMLTPFIFLRLNIDPAVATGPLVTTSNDILGLLIYFTIAYNFFIT